MPRPSEQVRSGGHMLGLLCGIFAGIVTGDVSVGLIAGALALFAIPLATEFHSNLPQ